MPSDIDYDTNTEMNFDFVNFRLYFTEIGGTAQVRITGSILQFLGQFSDSFVMNRF